MGLSNLYNPEQVKSAVLASLRHKKQLTALNNYSQVADVDERPFLIMLRMCYDKAFLDEKEADFLDHICKKYNLDFLTWSQKTTWLKGRMAAMSAERYETQVPVFGKQAQAMASKIPLHLLTNLNFARTRRAS